MNDKHSNSDVVNTLEAGDWITSINGTSTSDKDKTFIERVKHACHDDILILVIRKPLGYQEFYLWDPNQVTINIRPGLKELPFTLDIFHMVNYYIRIIILTSTICRIKGPFSYFYHVYVYWTCVVYLTNQETGQRVLRGGQRRQEVCHQLLSP